MTPIIGYEPMCIYAVLQVKKLEYDIWMKVSMDSTAVFPFF